MAERLEVAGTNQGGHRYSVLLTTVDQREEMALLCRAEVQCFAGRQSEGLQRLTEQLASVVAALAGDLPGRFLVSVPNRGQIDDLPREAVVEGMAEVSPLKNYSAYVDAHGCS